VVALVTIEVPVLSSSLIMEATVLSNCTQRGSLLTSANEVPVRALSSDSCTEKLNSPIALPTVRSDPDLCAVARERQRPVEGYGGLIQDYCQVNWSLLYK